MTPPKVEEDDTDSSSGSDYDVESYIKPKRVRKTVNNDTADILGNFDDEKRKAIFDGTYKDPEETNGEEANGAEETNPSDADEEPQEEVGDSSGGSDKEIDAAPKQTFAKIEDDSDESSEESENENNDDDDDDGTPREVNTTLTKEQLTSLLRGTAKANRHVLYVTNLNFETTKEDLEEYFGRVGEVKSVRIPKKRNGGFAFVEMVDLESFQRAFQLHNTELHTRMIKVQISEGGKKKSANKKNIMKQKNRKLSEMRNEQKTFTKSGKFYDKTLKKEKVKEMLARKRWRKPAGGPRPAR